MAVVPVPWDANLPACTQGWQERDQPDIVRSEVDVGQPKTRRRSTLKNRNVEVSWTMTADLYQLLMQFFETTLLGGIVPFYYSNPITGVVQVYRFVEAPSIGFVAGQRGVGAIQVQAQWELME